MPHVARANESKDFSEVRPNKHTIVVVVVEPQGVLPHRVSSQSAFLGICLEEAHHDLVGKVDAEIRGEHSLGS